MEPYPKTHTVQYLWTELLKYLVFLKNNGMFITTLFPKNFYQNIW